LNSYISSLFNLENKVAVVTGGGGHLCGEIAKGYSRAGCKVAILDLRLEKAEQVATEIESEGLPKPIALALDVSKKEEHQKALDSILKVYGDLDLVVNGAGINGPSPFFQITLEEWHNILNSQITGTFLGCQVYGEYLVGKGKGSIINISSIYGVVSPDQSLYEYRRKRGEVFFKPIAYAASKSALLNLTRYLAVYWAKTNVRVNTLVISGVYNGQEEEFVDAYTNRIPIGRMANYDEYNGAVIFLASEASKYMTGSNLTIDGGWTSI
jgi:NAD(P)-dependent dehydrogenase (short-subunit alcohol dehydrogenase family)